MNVLISIITPAYNSSKLISQTYQAILSQTYCNWEWIVTDDCSTDDTFEVLKKYLLKMKGLRFLEIIKTLEPLYPEIIQLKMPKVNTWLL
ncbi:glycosyltransferase [Vibrio parahaemolyticus]|nr:glycosyltransferase [Vibrio parahaemolyticus]